ncbi:hypothetical protein GOV03_04655 [Candidatus Woesearchaeota archaeon]|nr:hypothetical protein [Candidatus Woesearchaeota archaeon]
MSKINTLTKIVGSTLLAGVLFLGGHSIGEYSATNHFKPKIELKEKQNLELKKKLDLEKERLESEKEQKIDLEKNLELERLKRIEFEEIWEDSLFNYAHLGKVDLSRKKVTLDIYIDESEELGVYKKNKEKIFKYVSDFYKKMGVDLDIRFVDTIDQSALKPAKYLAIEIYTGEKCAQRDCELEGIETCRIRKEYSMDKLMNMYTAGIARIDQNIALACYCMAGSLEDAIEDFSLDELEKRIDTVEKTIEKGMEEYKMITEAYRKGRIELEKLNFVFIDKFFNSFFMEKRKKIEKLTEEMLIMGELMRDVDKKRTKKRPSNAGIRRKAGTIIHELGHLFGLYHSDSFTNDPVPDYLSTKRDTPNYMVSVTNPNYSIRFPTGHGFNEFQKRMVHSYLGGGKVYQQLEAVNFDFYKYLEHIKKANNYRE